MSAYPAEYLDDEAYDSSHYSHQLHPDFDHAGLAVSDAGYLSGTDKFPAFWDDAMSASSWSDAGIPDAMVDSGIAPMPEMMGADFYPERFLPPTAFSDPTLSKPRPHRSATAPSKPTSSPERPLKGLKGMGTKSNARHNSSRYPQRAYTSASSKLSAATSEKAKRETSPAAKLQSSRASSTSSSGSPTNNNDSSTNGSSKYTRTHYVVEKRYRTNLNDKFEELRDCLVSARQYLSEDYCPDSQLGGGDDQLRMSKTRVLGEAVEYIRHLEEQNDRAMDRIEMLERSVGLRDGDDSMSDS